jgi:hypothetical protein
MPVNLHPQTKAQIIKAVNLAKIDLSAAQAEAEDALEVLQDDNIDEEDVSPDEDRLEELITILKACQDRIDEAVGELR